MNFPCNSCGLCCQRIGSAIESARKLVASGDDSAITTLTAEFPHSFDALGRCSQLGENNQCQVYENRPLVCSVPRMYEAFYSEVMSREDFYALNSQGCKQLIEKAKTAH